MLEIKGQWRSCYRDPEGFYSLIIDTGEQYIEYCGLVVEEVIDVFNASSREMYINVQFFSEGEEENVQERADLPVESSD